MVRAPCCEKMGLKKGPWTPEEDQILTSFINTYGHGNWRALPKQAGLLRCGKSCRLRWINYLRPDIKRGNFSREEEDTIMKLHEMLGNRWSAIAARLPGRTDNEIKNVWHTHLKKRLNKKNPNINHSNTSTISEGEDVVTLTRTLSTTSTVETDRSEGSTSNASQTSSSSITDNEEDVIMIKEEANSVHNPVPESSNDFVEIDESFWSDPFSTENSDALFIPSLEFSDASREIFQSQDMFFDDMSSSIEHDMDFWYDIFIKAGGTPELPEF